MKLNNHEQAKPNVAGLTSQVQQAEMKLILAGRWPPLKPLPVFKYGTDEYRAEIHFDSTRGEWVCRKTSFPSNKVLELRGGLIEMTMALPHGQAEVFTEAVAAEQQEQELENEANRRHQAILEWREKYENGALYSKLQDYLSESQQDEIHDSIRMTLTARQLQFNPKNVEFVFEALWKAGGRLATIIEIAQRKKAEQEADAQAQAESDALEAERQVPVETIHPTPDRRLHMRTTPASLAYVMFGDTNGGIVLNISDTGMAVAVADLVVVDDYLPRIRIQLPRSRQSIEISAQIVWLAESKKGAGIRFVDLTADARNQISNWIASEKPAHESEQQPKVLCRENQRLEISPRKPRRIFSEPSTCDEEAAGRYAAMFPSESTYAGHTTPVDETAPKQGPVQFPATTPTDSGVTMSGSAAETSIGDVPQSQEAAFTPEHTTNFLPEPINTFVPELSEGLKPESVESVLPTTLESFPTEPIGSLSLDEVQSSSAELIASAATRASRFVAREILGASPVSLVAGPQKKKQYHTAVAGFGPQVRTDKVVSSADCIGDSPSQLFTSETSAKRGFGFRLGALVFLAIGFTVGFTVGLNTPAVPPETEESRSGSQSAQSPNARSDNSATQMRSTGPSSSATSRSDPSVYSESTPSANKPDGATPSEKKPEESAQDSLSLAKVPPTDSNSYPTIEFKPSANPKSSPEPNGSTGLIAQNAPPHPRREPAHSLKAVDQVRGAPRHPALRRVTLATLRPSPPSTILVTPPAEGSKSLRLTFPEKPIAAWSSFAITSQLSVLVPPEPGPVVAHKAVRLQPGGVVSYVLPRYPRPRDRHGSSETVKVRATIGQLGQVLDIKFVNGSISLLPATISAIRRWRYKPTLLNGRPVQAQQDVTIEFRPPQSLSLVSAHRASLN
jgi:TonB family protein